MHFDFRPPTPPNHKNRVLWSAVTASDKNVRIANYLGATDAEREWTSMRERVERFFFPVRWYEDFISRDKCYLFGRRGTGKTAIIRMLDFKANAGAVENYLCSHAIGPTSDYLDAISSSIKQIADFEKLPEQEKKKAISQIRAAMREKWRWIIDIAAMIGIVRWANKMGIDKGHPDLPPIFKYLRLMRINLELCYAEGVSVSGGKVLFELVERALRPRKLDKMLASVKLGFRGSGVYSEANVRLGLDRVGRTLRRYIDSPRREDALSAVKRFTDNYKDKAGMRRPGLVIIESPDTLNVDDKLASVVVGALFDVVYDYSKEWPDSGITAKLAFPEEMFRYVKVLNRGHVMGSKVNITWSYKDLVQLLARRICVWQTGGSQAQLEDIDTFEEAKVFLESALPAEIRTSTGVIVGPIGYILRHTQRKPRHVIYVGNMVYSYAVTHNNYDISEHRRLTEREVTKGVHCRINEIVEDCLNIYENIYDHNDGDVGLKYAIQGLFEGQDARMKLSNLLDLINGSDMGKRLRDIMRRKPLGVVRELVEMGVLGKERREAPLGLAGLPISQQRWVVETHFIYMADRELAVNPPQDSILTIHPAMYQTFDSWVDIGRFTMPTEQEYEMLMEMRGIS